MLDQTGVLSEYRPFHPVTAGDVCDIHPEHGEYYPYLNEYDFSWQPDLNQRRMPQLYLEQPAPLSFKAEGSSAADPAALKAHLKGQPLRIPVISRCWGRSSWMFADSLLESLSFAPLLGITRRAAELTDAAGGKHQGYSALSFHKALTPARANLRLPTVAQEQRLLIYLDLGDQNRAWLIHESLLQKWVTLGADLQTVFSDEVLSIRELSRKEFYYASGGSRSYNSIADYQQNVSGYLWGE
ncbi:MAG: hypothetical protein MK185_00365 [Saccharospirillaceae bacterium]|nr:hypothetical protein [Saccharospirillaceae bacterium]